MHIQEPGDFRNRLFLVPDELARVLTRPAAP